jgi:hypothetical protein
MRQVIKAGDAPMLIVTIVNRGNQEVLLVRPGDGSQSGWRTPIIEWSTSAPWQMRCGNINGLESDEVFSLKPGESRQLNVGVGTPNVRSTGTYRVAFRYENMPDLEWSGVPLKEHDSAAMDQILRSTRTSVVSNSVEIAVER